MDPDVRPYQFQGAAAGLVGHKGNRSHKIANEDIVTAGYTLNSVDKTPRRTFLKVRTDQLNHFPSIDQLIKEMHIE